VAAVIAFVSLDGYPPQDQESVGAIGAAKRYRSEQITESDVQLQDAEAVALLQSDEFQKLIQDESFQKAARDQNWKAMMANDRFRRVFLDEGFMRVMVDGEMARRMRDNGYQNLQAEEAYKVFLAQLEEAELNVRGVRLSEIVGDNEFKKLFVDNAVVRKLVLDEELIRQRLDVDVVDHPVDVDWKNVRLETDFAKLRALYTDAAIAGRNPRLAELANDAELAKLYDMHAIVRRFTVEEGLMRHLIDQELRKYMRSNGLATATPDDSYAGLLRAAKNAELAAPGVRTGEMGTELEFQKFFTHELAGRVAFDADFFKPLVDDGLASRLGPLSYANIRPEEKYAQMLKAVEDAQLVVSKDRFLEVARDAQFASWFKDSKFLQSAVLDAAWARKFYEVALASRARQTELINLRPEDRLAGWMREASDAALNSPDRRLPDYAADAEFKRLVQDHTWARKLVTDQNLMRVLSEAGLASRLADIKYSVIRPEEALKGLQTAVADAHLNNPKYDVEALVHDADFMKVYLDNGMLRRIMTDVNYARLATEAGMASRFSQFELVNLRPQEAYRAIWDEVRDAELASRNARMASWAADAEFKSLFQNMNLAQTIALDADMMKLMVDSDFATAAARADLRNVVSDANYMSDYALKM
jgi:hypothetical protein